MGDNEEPREPSEEEKAFMRKVEAMLEMSERTIDFLKAEADRLAALMKEQPAHKDVLRERIIKIAQRLDLEKRMLEKLQ